MDLKLTGRVALITGGSRGIGRATALALAREGCSVGICARDDEGLLQTVPELLALGVEARGYVADVAGAGEVEGFVEQARADLGRVDFAVANVGGAVGGRFMAATREDWVATFALNVGHAAALIRACVPRMAEVGGGAAVIVSSIAGWKPAPRPQYGAAKAAEIYLACELGRELAPDRIRVNAVSPGSIFLPGVGWDRMRADEPERFQAFLDRDLPHGRLGTVDEVADVVTFLLSDRASWVTGTHIHVDGAQGRAGVEAW